MHVYKHRFKAGKDKILPLSLYTIWKDFYHKPCAIFNNSHKFHDFHWFWTFWTFSRFLQVLGTFHKSYIDFSFNALFTLFSDIGIFDRFAPFREKRWFWDSVWRPKPIWGTMKILKIRGTPPVSKMAFPEHQLYASSISTIYHYRTLFLDPPFLLF